MLFLRRSVFLLACACAGFVSFPASSQAADAPTHRDTVAFTEKVAAANRAATEKSWGRARSLFAEAQAFAPDAPSRRWAELWTLDAKWRSEGLPNDWHERNNWREKIEATYERLSASADGETSDGGFRSAVMDSRLAFVGMANPPKFFGLRLALADHYAAALLTDQAIERYCAILRAEPSERYYGSRENENFDRWLEHLERGAQIALRPAERAEFAIRAAAFATDEQLRDTSAQVALWTEAVKRSDGTGLAALARAEQFICLVRTGYSRNVAPNTAANIPERLSEARKLHAALEATEPTQDMIESLGLLDSLIADWSRSHLLLDLPSHVRPNTPLVLRYGGEGLDRVTVTLYRHSLESWARRGADLSELDQNGKADGAAFAREVALLRASGAKILSTHDFTLTGAVAKTWRTGEVKLADALAPGFYSALIESTGATDSPTGSLHFVVSEFEATVVSVWGHPATLFVSRVSDAAPVSNRKIDGWLKSVDRPWSAELDDDGSVRLPASGAENWARYPLAMIVDGHPVIAEVSERNMRADSFHADLIFDRPLYRPGETVHWKLVLRERRDGRFQVARPTCALVGEARDTVVLEAKNLRPNAFGTVHGSFTLPQNLRSEEVGFTLNYGTNSAGKPLTEYFSRGIRVDSFVPPAIQTRIELASAPESLRPGGEIVARVRTNYLSGGPVVGAAVTCTFGVGASPGAKSAISREWERRLPDEPQHGITSADGSAEFRLRLPPNWPASGYVAVGATVSPENAPDSVAQAAWKTSRTGYVLDPGEWTDARAIRPGETVEFVARLTDGRGETVAKTAIARLVRLTWSEAWLSPEGAVVSGEALAMAREKLIGEDWGELPPPWKRLHAGYARDSIAEKSVSTNASGVVRVAFEVPMPGVYQLELALGRETVEPTGGRTNLELAVVAASDDTVELPLSPGAWLFATGKPARAGEKLPVLAVVPGHVGPRLLIVNSENAARVRRIEGARRVQWLDAELPTRPGPGQISLTTLRGRFRAASTSFQVDDATKHLGVDLAPTNETTRPGASGELQVRVTGDGGRPAAAEVSVSVADAAVYELVGHEGNGALEFSRYAPYLSPPEIRRQHGRAIALEEQLSDSRPGSLLNPSRARAPLEFEVLTLSPFMVASERTDVGIPVVRPGMALGAGMNDLMDAGDLRVSLRTRFSLTAAWEPEVVTDAKGEAHVSFTYPDSLTRWKIVAHAIGADGNSFGHATAFTRTELPFQARVQAPRFLVAGDRADIGGLFLNRTAQAVSATPSFVAGGAASATATATTPDSTASVEVPANGEAHHTWSVEAPTAGEAEFTLTARAGQESDGMRVTLPVHPDGGWQKTVASAVLTSAAPSQTLRVSLPARLDAGRARLSVALSPGHLPALLDALPYLVDYPYGCVEQTMSRMFPALVVRETLTKLGFSADEVERRVALRESAADQKRREQTAGIDDLDDVASRGLALLRDARTAASVGGRARRRWTRG